MGVEPAGPIALGTLADPLQYSDPVEIQGRDPMVLQGQLRLMLLIRGVERHLAKMREAGEIGGPVHLCVGQEAIAVGVSHSLRATDRVFGSHRSHAHVLGMGASVHRLFAEVLGKDTGLSRGMGGSMHLWDGPNGFMGSVPIVGGTVPLAVGAGLAEKMKGTDNVAVAYFGDGACEEGIVQESLNLARLLDVPVLFVVENNLFSSHMHISLRQPSDATARFAAACGVPYQIVDGNDVTAVSDATAQLVAQARDGDGPGFLEAVTYRWYGHVDFREDIDVGVARSADVLAQWKTRDPVARLVASMLSAGLLSDASYEDLRGELQQTILKAWAQAVEDPWPKAHDLLDRVFVSRSKP